VWNFFVTLATGLQSVEHFLCCLKHDIGDSRNPSKYLFATAGIQNSNSYKFRPFLVAIIRLYVPSFKSTTCQLGYVRWWDRNHPNIQYTILSFSGLDWIRTRFLWRSSWLVLWRVGGLILVVGWEETAYQKCCLSQWRSETVCSCPRSGTLAWGLFMLFCSPEKKGEDQRVNGPTPIVNTSFSIYTTAWATRHPRIHRK
jgi:hypothetical protein